MAWTTRSSRRASRLLPPGGTTPPHRRGPARPAWVVRVYRASAAPSSAAGQPGRARARYLPAGAGRPDQRRPALDLRKGPSMAEFVRLEIEDNIGTIRLDRPPGNALNDQLTAESADGA